MKKIKIALGMQLQEGAFGGGNQFGKSLVKFLADHNVNVVFNLDEEDIDIILFTEVRKFLKSCLFDSMDVARYLLKKPDTLVVFRINDCDERKGHKIKLLNHLILQGTKIADQVVFISNWLKELFYSKNKYLKEKSSVIYNGADITVFNSKGYKKWDKKGPLRIVTHHWGGNWFKGFDIYLKLDELIEKKYKNKIYFTFIGNLPKGVRFKNTMVIPPKGGEELAREIKKNHIYLTASINEPAGMHHIEGVLCGLPLLYRNSGALPEYCQGYGVAFNSLDDFEENLTKIITQYDYWVNKVQNYQNTAEKMCQDYYDLFFHLLENKKNILNKRTLNAKKMPHYIILVRFLLALLRIKNKVFNVIEKIR